MFHRLSKKIKIQLAIFAVISLAAVSLMFVQYLQVPTRVMGIGRYIVTVELPQAGGLYSSGNVTYRGVTIGRVDDVRLSKTGAEAVLRLDSAVPVPADVDVNVHSVSAVGEQYVELSPPAGGSAPPLKDGDVIPMARASIPPDINSLLAATNKGLLAIPGDNLNTAIDEAYVAFGGLGPEFTRFVRGATTLAIDARKNLESLVTLIDESKPILDSQTDSADSIQAWAAHLASVTQQLRDNDSSVTTILKKGAPATDETRQLLDRLQDPVPPILSNLYRVGEVGVNYRDSLEQTLVLFPQLVAVIQGINIGNLNTKQDYAGAFLSFNLNLNVPPPCVTGYLPPQQQRAMVYEDRPVMPNGDVYCRIPQDAPNAVRGARNYPCETKPGKRAPTAQMCESDEEYVPLNDGYYWKGDANATYSGQDVPQVRTGQEVPLSTNQPGGPAPGRAAATGPTPPPMAAADYEPTTGTFVGSDGQVYTPADVATASTKEKTWQEILMPPALN